MQLFFFDVETTGFTGDIIQFGAIYGLFDPETKIFHEERIINQYVKTDKGIEPGAFAVHGINHETIRPFKYIDAYIKEFMAYIVKADYIIGHNISFDCGILKKELMKCGMDPGLIETADKYDTMKDPMTVLGLTKRPKLQELHKQVLGKEFENAHDAMADIRATKDIFIELYKTGQIALS